jgi:hypothetical protein
MELFGRIIKFRTTSTSETPVNFYQTTRLNNPEESCLHTRRRENIVYRIPRIFWNTSYEYIE